MAKLEITLKRTLIVLPVLAGAMAAIPTFSDRLLDSPVVLLLLPGLIAAIAISRNVHAFPIWLAAFANFVFYFFLTRGMATLLKKFRTRPQ